MFEFGLPWVFVTLPLALLCFIFLPANKQEQSGLKVPFFHSLDQYVTRTGSSKNNRLFRLGILSLIWLLLVTAAAKPQWIGEKINLPTSGRDLLVAVDISGSMKQPDMVVEGEQIPRINVVKYIVGEFIERREGDRLGLVLFGSNAYLQSPLTFDRATVKQFLLEAQLGFAGEQTAIGDAIGLSVKRLRDRPADKRVLILLTDGANTAGEVDPRQAADLAKLAGVKIYTVGIGADSMEVEQNSFFRNFKRTINPSRDLDEDTLNYIADTTGGQYFRARSPQELNKIYTLFDSLEPIEQDEKSFRPVSTLYYYPLLTALILSFLLACAIILRPYFYSYFARK